MTYNNNYWQRELEVPCPFKEGDQVIVKEPYSSLSEGLWEVGSILPFTNEVRLVRPVRGGHLTQIWKKYSDVEFANLARAQEAPEDAY